MKSRIYLILVAVMITLPLAGCQQTAAKTGEQPIVVTEEAPKPAKPAKPAPQKNEYKVSWDEKCSVEQANSASWQALKNLGLGINAGRTRTVKIRNPKTGRIISKRVPDDGSYLFDGLSAVIETRSASGIAFRMEMLLQSSSPEITRISITTTSHNQPKDILRRQCEIIREKVSKAIQDPELEVAIESLPYPETMVFDRTVKEVYSAIYNWAREEKFKPSGGSDDKYYQYAECESDSSIQFRFTMRLIDDNKTKLEIKVSNYEDKDEFNIILKGLLETLETLKTDQPASKASTYTETQTLNHPIAAVYDTLVSWYKEKGFNGGRGTGGDAFYKYLSCSTASGIDFHFKLRLIDDNETNLKMFISDQKDKEEFPMILKSLEEALKTIGEVPPESAIVETK